VDTTAALERHAPETLASAHGTCVVLYGADNPWGPLPGAVTEVLRLPQLVAGRCVDSVVSVGQLGAADDLARLATTLLAHAHDATDLLFCEPTASRPDDRRANDVTGDLWRAGWSIVDCGRYRVGHGRTGRELVWGRARVRRHPPAARTP
jgi:hypothetical protein